MTELAARSRTNWTALTALAAGMFIVNLDLTFVAIALPEMRSDLGVSTTMIEWVVLGYALPVVALALPIGRLVDQVAARHRLFAWAVVGFAVASVAIGFSPSVEAVVAGRIVQGAFAAVITSLIPIMVLGIATSHERGRAMSVIATVGPLGAVFGPTVGGQLLEVASWNWLFFINVPICAVVLLFAHGRFEDATTSPGTAVDRRWVAEAGLLVIATGSLLYGLTKIAEEQWLFAAALLAATVAATALWMRTTQDRRLVEMLRSWQITRGPLGLVMMTTCAGAIALVMPFILTDQFGVSIGTAGNTIVFTPIAMVIVGPLGGVLADRFGPPRVALAGALVACVASVLLLGINPGWSLAQTGVWLFLVGAGLGLFLGPNLTMTMSAAPADGGGAVSSMTTLTRNLGFALGPALATIVWHLASITDAFWVSLVASSLAAATLIPLLVTRRRAAPPLNA